MAELRNLTPHEVNIHTLCGEVITVKSSGLARCTPHTMVMDAIPMGEHDSITITKVELGDVEGLPDPEDGVIFIVSRPVAEKMRGIRTDLMVPGTLIRNEKGQPIGCDGLSVI